MEQKEIYNMQDLMDIVKLLRHPVDGCPWDKEQTHESIRQNFIEETYEVADAIDLKDKKLLCEELGDVLLQIAMHTQMQQEQGGFTIDDVTTGVCKKLIERHPHIFGKAKAENADEVLQNWEAIKRKEKKRTTAAHDLDSVPKALPQLIRSVKLQKRAGEHGFIYKSVNNAFEDLESEVQELKIALSEQDKQHINHELADVIFAACNVANMQKIDAEKALCECNERFANRVKTIEELAQKQGKTLTDLNEQELDILWNEAKVLTKLQ